MEVDIAESGRNDSHTELMDDVLEDAANLESKSVTAFWKSHSLVAMIGLRYRSKYYLPANPSNLLAFRFFEEGYAAGHAHGQLHGLFEGRALGQEKAWEIWEEVGFYEGFSEMSLELLSSSPGGDSQKGNGKGRASKEERAINHARQLLALIATFPITNPTSNTNISNTQTENISETSIQPLESMRDLDVQPTSDTQGLDDTPDLALLLSAIRAKYRLLCTAVGARPRLVAAQPSAMNGGVGLDQNEQGMVAVEGIEGPMKGVDTRQLRF